jgi:hypothetical protein
MNRSTEPAPGRQSPPMLPLLGLRDFHRQPFSNQRREHSRPLLHRPPQRCRPERFGLRGGWLRKNDRLGFDIGARQGWGNGLPSPQKSPLAVFARRRARGGGDERRWLQRPVDAAAIMENAPRRARELTLLQPLDPPQGLAWRFPQSLGKRFAFPTSVHRPNLLYVSFKLDDSISTPWWRLWKTPPFTPRDQSVRSISPARVTAAFPTASRRRFIQTVAPASALSENALLSFRLSGPKG